MSKELGVKAATWSNYESGATEPDIDTVIKIASYFELSLDQIVLAELSTSKEITDKGDLWSVIKVLQDEVDNIKKLLNI